MMSKQSTFTAALATMLGATLGGLFLWRSIRTQKRKALKGPASAEPIQAQLEADITSSQPARQELSTPPQTRKLLRAHSLLEVPPVIISSQEEWEALWPDFQKDLSVYPVLGLDCEWVSVKGKASAVSLLQMATFSGRCMLVRLLTFRNAQLPLPKGLLGVLSDPRVLKVGVGCYEDGKRLVHDHGLSLIGTVDLRYLALRQRQAVLNNGLSLKSLAADLLNVNLDKSLELRCSDWEADVLTCEQMAYAAHDRGKLVSDSPFIVRLLFEPSGRPDSQKDYYLTAKENVCVVCGKADSYIRKNIVPHEYRRHFPAEMKDHNSHDILLLCTSCHAASNVHDGVLKQQLAEEYSAPQGCEEGIRLLEDADRRRVRSAARALLSASDGMPQSRKEELLSVIQSFFCDGQQEVTQDVLQKAAALETRIFNESYVPHGLKVVQAFAERGLCGLMELERCWRQHFLTSMQPRHLPPLWSVSHNHDKYLRKYGEDLQIQLN
ncbi:exonuclease 3'-5' domain-containing protein 2 [Garra rufa]|uniref:exonuclease 3'-5' domain-containing protein 2 n=1 Tax=Garra rufa TaxID=137080 RepID=UPI003CCEB81A